MCRFWGGTIAIVGVSLGVILASCLNINHASFANILVMGKVLDIVVWLYRTAEERDSPPWGI